MEANRAEGALGVCTGILEDIAAIRVPADDGTPVTLTMSAGTATLLQGDDERDLFRRADEALYRAKAHGRNRTEQATAGIS